MLHNVVILLDESQASDVLEYAELNDGNPVASNSILAMTTLADKQEETSVEFFAPKKPGKYLYICTYIAHGGNKARLYDSRVTISLLKMIVQDNQLNLGQS
ncbi:MAG: hypothetical protein Ct9H300mP18_01760 [Candidatus Neomarinimicrobiota bacterium]|nr:MAG: hypothetical protein Ct9H300mP18_01760 [Candidatus Neomarinimicrobiota bacterium]